MSWDFMKLLPQGLFIQGSSYLQSGAHPCSERSTQPTQPAQPAVDRAFASVETYRALYGKTSDAQPAEVSESCHVFDSFGGYVCKHCETAFMSEKEVKSHIAVSHKEKGLGLPTDDKLRKELQLWTFLMEYFPDAFLAVVGVAVAGNKQHNPGQKLHWAREKSTDQMNTAFRHMWDYGRGVKRDTDGQYHLAKAIWRLSAQLQLDIEEDRRNANV